MSEKVYVVRLTEKDRAEIEYACRLQWAQAINPNIAHWKRRVEALQSARPEHPALQDMSDGELLGVLSSGYTQGKSAKEMDADINKLARRLRVMRELCEEYSAYDYMYALSKEATNKLVRVKDALQAYRAMKDNK